jgi:hypothetical protein
MEVIDKPESIEIIMQVALRSYAGKKIAYGAQGKAINIQKSNHDESLIRAIVNSYKWNKMLERGEVTSITHLAALEKVERTYVGDVLRLKYLSPKIVTMILNGTQPRTLTISTLIKNSIPLCWKEQEDLLHIA